DRPPPSQPGWATRPPERQPSHTLGLRQVPELRRLLHGQAEVKANPPQASPEQERQPPTPRFHALPPHHRYQQGAHPRTQKAPGVGAEACPAADETAPRGGSTLDQDKNVAAELPPDG